MWTLIIYCGQMLLHVTTAIWLALPKSWPSTRKPVQSHQTFPFIIRFSSTPPLYDGALFSLRREGPARETKLDLECSLLANTSIVTGFMSLKLCSTVAVVTGRTICRDARVTRFGKAAFSVLSVSRRLVATCRSSVDDLYWENSTCRNIFHSLSFSFLSIFGVENQAISSHQVYHRRTLPDYLQR